jgi:hypothetical protein
VRARVPASEATTLEGLRPTQPTLLPGEHRVVVHTIEGSVKRGVIDDLDLAAEYFALVAHPGLPGEPIAVTKTKAIFFLLQPGEAAHPHDGRRVKVQFLDGRTVEGYLGAEVGRGFFLYPLDGRTNTARVYVLSHAVRSVA